jgi:hypothetical protein
MRILSVDRKDETLGEIRTPNKRFRTPQPIQFGVERVKKDGAGGRTRTGVSFEPHYKCGAVAAEPRRRDAGKRWSPRSALNRQPLAYEASAATRLSFAGMEL